MPSSVNIYALKKISPLCFRFIQNIQQSNCCIQTYKIQQDNNTNNNDNYMTNNFNQLLRTKILNFKIYSDSSLR